MRNLLLLIFLFASSGTMAQRGMLFIKKHGHKKMTYEEGSPIVFKTTDGSLVQGYISLIKGDTVYVNNTGWPAAAIRTIIRPRPDATQDRALFLYTTAGVALATTGMTLAHWTSFKTAIATSAGLGYGQFLLHMLPRLKRKNFPIGRKFSMQLIDLHF